MERKTFLINRAGLFFQQNSELGNPIEFTLGNGQYQKFVSVILYLFLPYESVINFINTNPYKAIEALEYNKYFRDKNIEKLLENTDEKYVIDTVTEMVNEIYGSSKQDIYVVIDIIPGAYGKKENYEKICVGDDFQHLVGEFACHYNIVSYKVVMKCNEYPNLIPVFIETSFPVAN
jgi:hypothetical protein